MKVVRVGPDESLGQALERIDVRSRRPVLVVVGGAAALGAAHSVVIDTLFRDVVVPVAASLGVTLVDGGTDSGVMRSLGEAVAAAGCSVPLVGVTVAALARDPDAPDDDGTVDGQARLERHHSHVLLVDGTGWGDETGALAQVAGLLAVGAPTATLLVNGGEVSRSDVTCSLELGRPVVVVRGSGRLADELADSRPPGVVVLEPRSPVDDQRRMLGDLLGDRSAV